MDIQRPSGVSRAWIPLPLAGANDWHRDQGDAWSGNAARAEVMRDPKYGVEMLYVEWTAAQGAPYVEVTSRFATRDRAVDLSRPRSGAARLSDAETRLFTAPTELIPTDGIVRETAESAVKGSRTDWLAYNTGHDLALPHSRGPKLPYLMYPNGETGGERLDQLDPDAFKYAITARELKA